MVLQLITFFLIMTVVINRVPKGKSLKVHFKEILQLKPKAIILL